MTKRKSSVILPVVLIALSICVILGTTLAYFTDTRGTSTPVNFGKIEISVDEPFSSTVSIKDAIPGIKITDKVAFKKAVDSEDMYVRAKVLFTTTSEDTNIQNLVTELNTYELDIKEYLAGDFAWSDKYGDYIYLVERETPSNAYNITSTDEIIISDRIELPRELRQSVNYAQYFQSINLLIELQAIQSYNVSKTLTEVDTAMGDIYNGFGMEQFTDPKYFKFDNGAVTGLSSLGKDLTEISIPSSYGLGEIVSVDHVFYSRPEMDDFRHELMDSGDMEAEEAFWNWQDEVMAWEHDFNTGSLTYTVQEQMYTYGNIPVTSIGEHAFSSRVNLKKVTIPNQINEIGQSAFIECRGLVSINIPSGVTIINSSVFSSCSSLTNIIIPDGVTSIGYGAFMNCTNLVRVDLPNSVTSIGNAAFSYCHSLVQVVNPNNINRNAFPISNVGFQMDVSMDLFNNKLEVIDDCFVYSIYENDHLTEKYLMGFATPKEQVINLPEDITSVYQYAFYRFSDLKQIELPNNLKSLGKNAFMMCAGLTRITIPECVTNISNSLFYDCVNLIDINFSDNIESIENYAFYGCSELQNIDLPSNLISIGNSAFENCTGLTSVSIPETLRIIGHTVFIGCTNLVDLTISHNVTSVGQSLLSNCENFTNVYFKGSSEQWITWSSNIQTNEVLIGATRYYIYLNDSNDLIVAVDNAGEEEAVDSGAYTSAIDRSDPSKIVATVTFLNGEGDEDNYKVTVTKELV